MPFSNKKRRMRWFGHVLRMPENTPVQKALTYAEEQYNRPTMVFRNYWNSYEKRCCSGGQKQCKILLKDHMARLKTMSIYTYKDLSS